MATRQTTRFVQSLLQLVGLERYAKNLNPLTLPEIKDLGALGDM